MRQNQSRQIFHRIHLFCFSAIVFGFAIFQRSVFFLHNLLEDGASAQSCRHMDSYRGAPNQEQTNNNHHPKKENSGSGDFHRVLVSDRS